MAQRKYTLPRHTNLARQGSRIGAFLIDLAIVFAVALGLYLAAFQFVFKKQIRSFEAKLREDRIKSHLYFEVEGKINSWGKDSDNQEFLNSLAYFYTYYIPFEQEDADQPVVLSDKSEVKKIEYFTLKWFNENVLKIEGDGAAIFEYQKVGEEQYKDVIGLIKNDSDKSVVNQFLQSAYIVALNDFHSLPSVAKTVNSANFRYTCEFVISLIISTNIFYLLIPYIIKDGVTIGKKVFGLCLADSEGYKLKNKQLFMRVMPIDIVIFGLLLPIWGDLTLIVVMFAIVFLVSFTFVLASPKRMALHDFTARTIVVDAKTSILFSNGLDEAEYIAKEEGISLDEGNEISK